MNGERVEKNSDRQSRVIELVAVFNVLKEKSRQAVPEWVRPPHCWGVPEGKEQYILD